MNKFDKEKESRDGMMEFLQLKESSMKENVTIIIIIIALTLGTLFGSFYIAKSQPEYKDRAAKAKIEVAKSKKDSKEYIKYKEMWDDKDYFNYDYFDLEGVQPRSPLSIKRLKEQHPDKEYFYEEPENSSDRIKRWERLSKDHPIYIHLLAQAHIYGDGVLKDKKKAFSLFIDGVKKSLVASNYRLGEILCEEREYKAAKKFVKFAFDNTKDSNGKIMLGISREQVKHLWNQYELWKY